MSFDKKIITKNFSRGAKNYDEASEIQALSAKNLITLASPFIFDNSRILDLGSGTSFIAKNLFDKKNLQIFEIDLSHEMLKSWTPKPKNIFSIQSDIEKLPFRKNSFDVIISSFSLQWINNFSENFSRFSELLKPNGILAFAIPTDESLHELKAAQTFNINDFPHFENLRNLLKNNFEEKIFSQEILKQEFANGLEALKSIKKIGANYSNKSPKKISKLQLKQFNNFCLKNSSNNHKSFSLLGLSLLGFSLSWKISYFISVKK